LGKSKEDVPTSLDPNAGAMGGDASAAGEAGSQLPISIIGISIFSSIISIVCVMLSIIIIFIIISTIK
jgi:hypothetical protein